MPRLSNSISTVGREACVLVVEMREFRFRLSSKSSLAPPPPPAAELPDPFPPKRRLFKLSIEFNDPLEVLPADVRVRPIVPPRGRRSAISAPSSRDDIESPRGRRFRSKPKSSLAPPPPAPLPPELADPLPPPKRRLFKLSIEFNDPLEVLPADVRVRPIVPPRGRRSAISAPSSRDDIESPRGRRFRSKPKSSLAPPPPAPLPPELADPLPPPKRRLFKLSMDPLEVLPADVRARPMVPPWGTSFGRCRFAS
mmetsp:Transcript_6584/g.14588  ORF Transcript_6584/g.14588 Transcript_6584/m.14588 type:complete len:253 (-) Transcript_6584:890-1648(-)